MVECIVLFQVFLFEFFGAFVIVCLFDFLTLHLLTNVITVHAKQAV